MSIRNKAIDRTKKGKIARKYTSPNENMTTPSWWTRMFMSRPRRQKNKAACKAIVRGENPDGMDFPLGNHKPHRYFW